VAKNWAKKSGYESNNISMVFERDTGIQMQQTSLSSDTNIKIQGLDGRYTALRDSSLYGVFKWFEYFTNSL
jgi:hypothetical protein